MCNKGISVEHGTLAFAILSMVGTGTTLLWSIIEGILIAIDLSNPHPPHVDDDHEGYKTIFKAILEGAVMAAVVTCVTVIAIGSLIAFIFSVLLFIGIRNRHPGKVLAYFIYGTIVIVLSASASIVYLCGDSDMHAPGIFGLSACAIYSPCLFMVYKTYTKLQQEAMFVNHVPLVDNFKLDP